MKILHHHKIRHSEMQEYCLNIGNDSQQLIKGAFKSFMWKIKFTLSTNTEPLYCTPEICQLHLNKEVVFCK